MQRYYIPALGNLWASLESYALPILRAGLGIILMAHGCQKLFGMFGGMGLNANAALFDRLGYHPGMFWGTLVGCTETFGGALLVIGLFTRPAALAVRHLHDLFDSLHLGQGFLLEPGRDGVFDPDPARRPGVPDPGRRQLFGRSEARQGILATPAYAGIRIVESIRVQASAQAVQASAQTAQCRCISPWRLHSSAQARQKAVQFASSASSNWR